MNETQDTVEQSHAKLSMRQAVEDARVTEARLDDAINVLRRIVHGPKEQLTENEAKKDHDKRFIMPQHATTVRALRERSQVINSLLSEIEYGTPNTPEIPDKILTQN